MARRLDVGLWRDEAASATAVARAPGELLRFLFHSDGGIAGYLLAMRAWTAVFGHGETSMRLPSLVAAGVTVYIVGTLAARLAGDVAGITAAVFVAVHPNFLPIYSTEARPYAIATACAALAGLSAHRVSTTGDRRSTRWWALAASAAIGAHLLTVFAIVPQLLWLRAGGALRDRRAALRVLALPLATTVVIGILAGRVTGLQSWIAPVSLSSLRTVALSTLTFGGGLVIAAAVPAIWAVRRWALRVGAPRAVDLIVCSAWAVVPGAALTVVSIVGTPVLIDRYLLASTAAVGVLVGVAAAFTISVVRSLRRTSARVAIAAPLVVAITVAAALAPGNGSLRPTDKPEDLRAASEWILEHSSPRTARPDGIVYEPTWAEAGMRWYLLESPESLDVGSETTPPNDVTASPDRSAIDAAALWTPTVSAAIAIASLAELDRVWVVGYTGDHRWEPVPEVGFEVAAVVRRCWVRRDARSFGIDVELWERPVVQRAGDCP